MSARSGIRDSSVEVGKTENMKNLIIAGLMLASTCAGAEDRRNLPVAAGPFKPTDVSPLALKITGEDLGPAPIVPAAPTPARDPIRASCVDFNGKTP
jgi:hypothetical protein